MVVIVIIGILSTISVSTFNGYFEKTNNSKIKNEISQIKDIIIADRASKGKESIAEDLEYNSSGSYNNGSEEIVKLLTKQGFKLPNPDKACYLILINRKHENIDIPIQDRSDFAIVSIKNKYKGDSLLIPISEYSTVFEKYFIASGTPLALDLLNDSSKTIGYKTLWANVLSYYLVQHYPDCKRTAAKLWNGISIAPSPYYNVFDIIPLDPSLAP